jgi:glutamate-1-semialdehyde 2,1-aminomutase
MMGKIIGGGLPVGALGGRADLMERFDPAKPEPIHHSGTFNGNPVTCAAGVVSVSELTAERIATMDRHGARIEAEIKRAAASLALPFGVRRAGSLLNLTCQSPAPRGTPSGPDLMASFHLAALNEGLFFAPRGLIALSTVITEELVTEICERMAEALRAAGNAAR